MGTYPDSSNIVAIEVAGANHSGPIVSSASGDGAVVSGDIKGPICIKHWQQRPETVRYEKVADVEL
jgi:hypothetical protein